MIRAAASEILTRVFCSDDGNLEPAFAQFILKLDFPPSDHQRIEELSAKAHEGALTSVEPSELEAYLHVNDFVAIVKSKARLSL